MDGTKKPLLKRFAFWLILGSIFVISTLGFFIWKNYFTQKDNQENIKTDAVAEEEEELFFTHDIFDVSKVSFIAPLGELNGGYNETQPLTGICINNKDASEIEVFAPTDMTLEGYSYASDGRNTANWHLEFRINQNMQISFDHITWVPDELRAATPPTQTSATVSPTKKLSFKAGELIAKTSGTDKAHNWNIYLIDNKVANQFVNQARYEQVKQSYSFLNAACPFNYYEDSKKRSYLALMGSTMAGQSATCGNPSKDVKGTLSGLWHLSPETDKSTFMGTYNGNYATPFSIYKNSANQIVFYEIGKKRYILGANNATYKDPAEIVTSHCYNLTEYSDDKNTKGYAYFKIISDMEMVMSYSPTGSCPKELPSNFTTYYR